MSIKSLFIDISYTCVPFTRVRTMVSIKDDTEINTTAHLETVSDQEKHRQSQDEEILGRDFTVTESELPKGYFTSANFLGSSNYPAIRKQNPPHSYSASVCHRCKFRVWSRWLRPCSACSLFHQCRHRPGSQSELGISVIPPHQLHRAFARGQT